MAWAKVTPVPIRNTAQAMMRPKAPRPAPDLPLPSFPDGRVCLFLDFDGTLVEFAAHPDDVVLSTAVRDDIARLHEKLGGALAIITGRPVEDIDVFLAPLRLPVAGVHGLVRRDSAGIQHAADFDVAALACLAERLQAFAGGESGLLVERKTGSVALHYRKRPELEAAAHAAMRAAVAACTAQADVFHVMSGKMVIEARAAESTKAHAIRDFLDEPPFAGRTPVFAGDDVTDEHGFAEINSRNGVSIKIGEGQTIAAFRIATIAEFHAWLHAAARN